MDNILSYLISTAGISTVLVFGIKFALNQVGKMGIEKYKNELKKETLAYKKDLDKDFEQFRIKYTRLHIDQVEAIKGLYKRIYKAELTLEELLRPIKVNPPKTDQEIAKEFVSNANDFFNYFFENEILFNETTCQLILKIKDQMYEAWKPYHLKQFMGANITGEMWAEMAEKLQKAYDDNIRIQIPALKVELKRDFRKYLGIVDSHELIDAV